MKYHIPFRSITTSLIVAMAVITAGVPAQTQAATPADAATAATAKVPLKADDKRKIGEANDLKLKARDPAYAEQAKALAEQYRETADMVARNGGNAQPLLDAAARLENQSEVISKARQAHPLPIQIPEPAAHIHKTPH
jgi:hypothetical protein